MKWWLGAAMVCGIGSAFALAVPGLPTVERFVRVGAAVALFFYLMRRRNKPRAAVRTALAVAVLETVVGVALAFTVDAPPVLAAADASVARVADGLDGSGIVAPPLVARAVLTVAPSGSVRYVDGRLVAADEFADALRAMHGQPVRVSFLFARHALTYRRDPLRALCLTLSDVDPPLEGYRLDATGRTMSGLRARCAIEDAVAGK